MSLFFPPHVADCPVADSAGESERVDDWLESETLQDELKVCVGATGVNGA